MSFNYTTRCDWLIQCAVRYRNSERPGKWFCFNIRSILLKDVVDCWSAQTISTLIQLRFNTFQHGLKEVGGGGGRVKGKRFQNHCPSLKGKVSLQARWSIRPELIPGFCSMKRLGVFLLSPGWDASPSQGHPQHFAGTYLYTWVERGTVRVKCLAQDTQHNVPSQDPDLDNSIWSRAP